MTREEIYAKIEELEEQRDQLMGRFKQMSFYDQDYQAVLQAVKEKNARIEELTAELTFINHKKST